MAEIDINNFVGENVGTGPIFMPHNTGFQLRPVKLFLKEDGAIGDKPSFAIYMVDPKGYSAPVLGQISLEMFNKALKDVGYEIRKK